MPIDLPAPKPLDERKEKSIVWFYAVLITVLIFITLFFSKGLFFALLFPILEYYSYAFSERLGFGFIRPFNLDLVIEVITFGTIVTAYFYGAFFGVLCAGLAAVFQIFNGRKFTVEDIEFNAGANILVALLVPLFAGVSIAIVGPVFIFFRYLAEHFASLAFTGEIEILEIPLQIINIIFFYYVFTKLDWLIIAIVG